MSHKTKAALQGRQRQTNKFTTDTTRQGAAGQSLSEATKSALSGSQPFVSIPRDLSSLRITRLSHAEIDSSPSISIACFIAFSNPGSTLKAICLLPRGNFVFDTCCTPKLTCLCQTMYNTFKVFVKQRSPAVLLALTGPLTKPLRKVTIMAESQHTQTHPEFTWRFLALSASGRNVIHITAATEREAREQSPAACVVVFAGRMPAKAVHHA